MDLNLKPFSVHSSFAAAIPFFVFVAVAVALQYFQMAQMNNRNRKTGPGDAEPAAGDAAIPSDCFRILLHGHPCRSCAVHDYFYSNSHNYSRHDVPAGVSNPRTMVSTSASDAGRKDDASARVPEQPEALNARPTKRLASRTPRPPQPQAPSRKQLAQGRSVKERRVNPWIG